MLDISRDINSLSSFKRNTVQFLRQLKETGQPVVLTINGKAELVIQDAKSYQKLLEVVDWIESIEELRQAKKDLDEGKGLSLEQVKDEVREKHGIPL